MTDLGPKKVQRRTRAENAAHVIDQVRELGITVPPTSRLMEMCRLSRISVAFDDPGFPNALEAVRDLQQLGFILDQLRAHRENPEFRALLKKVIKDSVLPQNDRKESVGRNSQFHLCLAAICQNAGLMPVGFNEPDVCCTIHGRQFGIAAKRIKSMDQIKGHIKKAAGQICRAKRPGIVALELSLALNPKNLPIVSRLQSDRYVPLAVLQGRNLFDKYHEDIYRWVRGKGVLAVLAFDFRIRLRPDNEWELDGMSTWLETAQDSKRANRQYKMFYSCFKKGIPNCTEIS